MKLRPDRSIAMYQDPNALPEGAEVLGVIERRPGDRGALVRLKDGVYVQMNAGAIRSLPQAQVKQLID